MFLRNDNDDHKSKNQKEDATQKIFEKQRMTESSTSSISTSSSTPPQDVVRRFTYLDSENIYKTLELLAKDYPNLVTLENSQRKYGLTAAGNVNDCTFDHHEGIEKGCLNWFLTIEDKLSHPEGSLSWKRLPEVFLSGALHGNERIGK